MQIFAQNILTNLHTFSRSESAKLYENTEKITLKDINMAIHLLIIGGDGDLAIRKLYPALYHLHINQHLTGVQSINAMARSEGTTASIRKTVENRLIEKLGGIDDQWTSFEEKLHYHRGDATSKETLIEFKNELNMGDNDELIVYLAVPPKIFGGIAKALGEVGLTNDNVRIIVEKPLGENLETFRAIDNQLHEFFTERQIFRIDHYLGKESIQSLFALRFSNIFFSKLWRAEYIDSVQITVAETVGVEKRKEFYDATGALRDMVQNHLLQILCLVAMDPPSQNNADMVRTEKLKVLQSLKPISLADIDKHTVRGQYGKGSIDNELVSSYQDDLESDTPSNTETFVAIRADIANWRWAGVPFYLRTGKRLEKRYSDIDIFFKPLRHNIFTGDKSNEPNHLQISLQPDSGIKLRFKIKKPELGNEIKLQNVELDLSDLGINSNTYDAYARLLLDALHNDQTLFVSAKEVEASWVWIDGIIENWKKAESKAHLYQSGSMGPNQAHTMLARDEREWDFHRGKVQA